MKDDVKFINQLSEQILKLWNEGDMTVLEEIYAPDFVRNLPLGEAADGREAMAAHVAGLRGQYPDLKITIVDKIYDGQTYVSRWRFQGTDLGGTADKTIPPTGKKVDFYGTNIYHLEGDILVDEYVYYDVLGAMQQLGLIPQTAAGDP